MNTQTTLNAEPGIIPLGYRKDAKGRLVPEAQIPAIDQERDQLVREIVHSAMQIQHFLNEFKIKAMADIAAFVELSAEQYGVKLGGNKGNVQLISFDGLYKVLRAVAENITFDERLQAAKTLIDECLIEWSENAPSELRAIVQDAFDVDKQGKISTGKILTLRRYKIDDDRWQRAMKAISDAIQVTGTKPYIRVYKRDAAGEYRLLNLDVAAV
ncbi:DUF3164 family protein [Lysobacter yananisis]|uniref:DUF3164 family protein n=1 Tax=Lysobacter yananisis TaxID=1003114 RepID=A0ABY9P8E0_9GAMM|nr:DUF3164 family protein [Lysobacter yananisis]WMT03338.1 DUF3164 family protein [Lysobacter yananisis]